MMNLLRALVAGKTVPNYGDGDALARMNSRGDLSTENALPLKTGVVRLGDTWTAIIPTASAFTFVAAWPTTRAELVVYNGEPAGGKSYVLDSAFLTNITSQAAAQHFALLGQLVSPKLAAAGTRPTASSTVLFTSRSGKGAYPGNAVAALANTAAGQIADKWEILGSSVSSPMTTNLGGAMSIDLDGAWIVPPGGAMCLAGLAGTAAGTAICGLTWHEVVLPVVS